ASDLCSSDLGNGDRGDTIKVEVYATDGHGGTSATVNDSVTVVNSDPVAGTVAISPSSPTTNQTLTATPSGFSDADGDGLTYHYQWYKNGTAVAGATGSSYDLPQANAGERGDTIKVEVYASDGHGGTSATVNDSVTVVNSDPVAGTVAISPSSPTTNQTLTATPSGFSDADGDGLTYHYQWYKNGTAVAGATGSSYDLPQANAGERGDTIKVEVYASDGHGGTSATVNDSVTVVNSDPVAGTVAISPSSPTTNQTLTATPSGFSDADGDGLTYHYQWYKNGTAVAGATGSTYDLSQPNAGHRDATIKGEVSATAGLRCTRPCVSDSVTVVNSDPVAGTVAISPSSPTTNQTLTATPSGFSDADGDGLTYHYQWYKNGTAVAGATGSTYDL